MRSVVELDKRQASSIQHALPEEVVWTSHGEYRAKDDKVIADIDFSPDLLSVSSIILWVCSADFTWTR